MTEKQLEANRRNARLSTGPTSEDGVIACAGNATRHGLRSLRPTISGEDPAEWEAHRSAVLADLAPSGAVETALAEQVAAKLWRLGRVVRHEADLIANAHAGDVIRLAHEKALNRVVPGLKDPVDIPTRKDVAAAKARAAEAEKVVAARDDSILLLDGLAEMADGDALPGWSPLYEDLQKALRLSVQLLDRLFTGDDTDGAFFARHARMMLAERGAATAIASAVLDHWREERGALAEKVGVARRTHRSCLRRYRAALDRRRLPNGLPAQADLDRIQRYEAHLERGMHKDLDGLRDRQESRGAVAPRGPSVAVAVVQGGADGPMGPFGIFAVGATVEAECVPAEVGLGQ
jgi:hypothetical protein